MNETLDDIASSIGGAHQTVDEMLDRIAEFDADPAAWVIGSSEEPPESDAEDAPPTVVLDAGDSSAARYVLRELLQRGLQIDGEEETVEGPIVYARLHRH